MTFCTDPDTAILFWEGIEGVTYNLNSEGVPIPTQERIDLEGESNLKVLQKYGFRNRMVVMGFWPISNYTRGQRGKSQPPYQSMLDMSAKYDSAERLENFAMLVPDEEMLVIQTNVNLAWDAGIANIWFAENDSDFEAAFAKMLNEMNRAGLEKLEARYSENMAKGRKMGIK
jgi:hypothetical protein